MSEAVENVQEQVEVQQAGPIKEAFFGGESSPKPTVEPAAQQVTPAAETTAATTETPDGTELVDANEYLKKTLGLNDWDEAKKVVDEYRQLKEKGSDLNFANEDSKRLFEYLKEGKEDELYSFLSEKKKLEKLVSADVNETVAADIVKFAWQKKYSSLTPEQIEYKFNKQFAIPKEPVQTDLETDDEFASRKSEWEAKVKEVQMDLMIEANLAKPDIEKYKTELILPEIKGSTKANEVTPEDRESFDKAKNAFLQSAKEIVDKFNGFEASVEDKDVKYNVNYAASAEEKTLVSNKIQEFAESGFDANALLAERWVSEDGKSLNVEQMVKDLSMLYNSDKVYQKMVTEAANKRIEAYLKEKKQINISEQTISRTSQFGQPENVGDKIRERMFA